MTPPADLVVGRLDVDQPAEVALLADLRRAWTEEEAGGPVDDPGFTAALARWVAEERDHRTVWVARRRDEPELCGMLNLLEYRRMPTPGALATRWGWVANVYVRPPERSQGIGRVILDAAVDHARARALERLIVHPSERSLPFYRRAGFGPAGDLAVFPLR